MDLSCEPYIYVSESTPELRVRLVPLNMIEPSSVFADPSKTVLLLRILFFYFMSRFSLCYTFLSVPCSLVITCWDMAGLLALLCVGFSCAFVPFSYGVPGQVWYFIGSILDLCLSLYFHTEI